MTTEKIQDELKELKEAHAADEGIFFFHVISFITINVCCVCHTRLFFEKGKRVW